MEGIVIGSSIGALMMLAVLVGVGFTPEVTSQEVKQAESVCKDSDWISIDSTEIKCSDGAVYKLKRK